ncbi:preprotein translocase subunit SecA [Mycolicibacterium austroafricanum]|uniref:preprotein translocase subunit SecA n=1 Tax=Mycolicibacterium austroafricanum TaxID=39687 RepID=UPI001CA32371|nr:preprotein translocase subunit SecA [Mycolicibacterium austroafricanum]
MLADVLRLGEARTVKQLSAIADHVDSMARGVENLTDAELSSRTDVFRKRMADGGVLDELLPEGFAVVREAAWRVLGLRPYHVQVMGGAALHFGNIAEMMTGEGKTLACVMPAYLNAIGGDGVHIVTVNDYLAGRDAEQMGRVHRFLGLTVGVILSEMKPDERRAAYAADITYGTNNEFGFDYLRDNMAGRLEDRVQRGHCYAIVDEVDSILIDEARTPMIISGPADDATHWYAEFARLAALMTRDVHYEVDTRRRTIGVSEAGVALVEDQLGVDNLYQVVHAPLVGHLNNAVRAKELFHRDREYIVNDDGEVLIVDEFTGRVLVGRRYNEGLHQAIEAKEGVEVKPENQTLATITLQNYFRLYDRLAGMTGTARSEASEFRDIYRLGVITIPPNRPVVRRDEVDVVYKTESAKFDAVVEDVVARHAAGQPVLIGTTSVEKSEYLSGRLTERRIPHTVLNAKHLEQEAAIVAEGGRRGAVTVATDMAGRGTDIMLGGNADFLTDKRLRSQGLHPTRTPEEYDAAWGGVRREIVAESRREAKEVVALGGLYVLGTERHESRRIDNQLRGRSGRQGDPGETRFYLSLGDELMRRSSTVNLEKLMSRLKMPEREPIKAKVVSRAIRNAQSQVEQANFDMRRNVVKYGQVLDQQRRIVYQSRSRLLEGEDMQHQIFHMIGDVVTAYVNECTAGRRTADWDLETLRAALSTLYPVAWQPDPRPHMRGLTRSVLRHEVIEDARRALVRRKAAIEARSGLRVMRELERAILLDCLDSKWRAHLYEMDYLAAGIGMRALAGADPVVEYHREGYRMFVRMLEAVKEQSIRSLFDATTRMLAPIMPSAARSPGTPDPRWPF